MRETQFAVSRVAIVAFCILAVAAQAQNSITTIAGGGPNNLPATKSSIGVPWGVVQDGAGNTYITDTLTSRVFKVDGSGTLTVLAGNIVSGYTLDGVANGAASAALSAPEGVAVDGAGNVYIADTANNVIRVVNPTGGAVTVGGLTIPAHGINTLAGDGTACPDPTTACGDGGLATDAHLNAPAGVFVDGTGNVFIADTADNKIREVVIATGNIATVAGTGVPCADPTTACGDGGVATSAQLNFPNGVFVDGSGIYIADTSDYRIRKVAGGNISTIAGDGTVCADPTTACGDGGAATSAQLNLPTGVFLDSSNLYIADSADFRIRKLSGGNISAVAGDGTQGFGGDGNPATGAQLDTPTSVFLDSSHNLFIADQNNDAIREVSGGNIDTLVGNIFYPLNGVPSVGFSGDHDTSTPAVTGTPTNAALRTPSGVTADALGNYYIADAGNNRLRVMNNQSSQITVAGVTIPAHTIETVAGNGAFCLDFVCGDGSGALAAQMSAPTGVTLDSSSNIFIVGFQDSAIRKVVAGGGITTVAGQLNKPGYTGDAGPAASAQLNQPLGMALDSAGNMFIADTGNNVIRVVNRQTSQITVAGVTVQPGNIDTVAGDGTACAVSTDLCGDGGAATSAQLNGPSGVAVDAAGNIYIADTQDNRIRKVDTTGKISKVAGTGDPCLGASCGDGGAATAAFLLQPFDMFVDYAGTVFIADSGDYVIRAVNTGTSAIVVDTKTIDPGNIDTVVGTGVRGYLGDGVPALNAQLAQPLGLGATSAGDLLITDFYTWRVRSVGGILATAPTATLSPNPLNFPGQILNTTSTGQAVTLTNNGNLTSLQITQISVTGDFAQTNNCGSSIPGPGSCAITVTFTPTATGTVNGTLAIQDSVGTQNVNLTGVGQDFTIAGTTPAPVSPGGSATSTISITPAGGYNSAVTLTCTGGLPSGAACRFAPSSITPPQTSTLTITTTAASASLTAPAIGHRSAPMYAMWLLLPAMLLGSAGMAAPKRRKLVGYILLFLAITGLLFLVACGGSSSNNGGGGGGGGGGTPAGSYNVTVTATPAVGAAHTTTVTLTVQ